MKKPTKAVIIGGGGYVGLHLIEKLQKLPYSITVIDFAMRRFDRLAIDYSRIEFVQGDFMDEKVLDLALPRATVVWHLAAVGMTGATGGDLEAILHVNTYGTSLLLQKCRDHGIRRFIYSSSVVVAFNGQPVFESSEDDLYIKENDCLSYYSLSKIRAEKAVLESSNENFKTCALRFRGIYGPGEPRTTERAVDIIRKGLWKAKWQSGETQAVTNYSSVHNCANSLLLAEKVMREENSIHGRAYNIVDDETVGTFDFWNPLASALGQSPPKYTIPYCLMYLLASICELICYRWFKTAPFITKMELALMSTSNTFSIQRARRELGYVPEPSNMNEVAQYYVRKHRMQRQKALSYTNDTTLCKIILDVSSVGLMIIISVIVLYILYCFSCIME